ncbi:hypothetical protein DL96DRAFT_1687902 [Flagelloscypha sp. PMI_526]|nr:hypothetical protein DL96DRAFT_1687902 [Flagelloscypha sp. PMI_526]
MKSPLLLICSFFILSLLALPSDALRIHRRGDPVGFFMDWTSGRWIPKMDRMNLLMVGDKEPDGSRKIRKNCIFYVNQKNVDPTDPNYAKHRALQFAEMMNRNRVGSDHHTLYDVYDLEAAFGVAPGTTRQDAINRNIERPWFQATSAAFANLCTGLVYLVVEPEDIWDGAIWVTDELPALLAGGRITEIVEVRPEDIGRAYDGGSMSVYTIPTIPYRGGQPPGSTPQRDPDRGVVNGTDKFQLPMIDKLVAMGDLDVSGDNTPPPLDPTDWTGGVCPGSSFAVLDGGSASPDTAMYWVVDTKCQPKGRSDPGKICESPLMTCDGAAPCPPDCQQGRPDISVIHIDGKDYSCVAGPTGPRTEYCARGTRGNLKKPAVFCCGQVESEPPTGSGDPTGGSGGPTTGGPTGGPTTGGDPQNSDTSTSSASDIAPNDNAAAALLSSGAATMNGDNVLASGALEGDVSSSSSFDKWIPTILGLLSGNIALTLLVAGLAISAFIRRRQSRSYAPVSGVDQHEQGRFMQERREYTDE